MDSVSFYFYVLVNRCLSWGHPCSVRFTRTPSITVSFTSRYWDHWPSVSWKCASCPTFIPSYYMALIRHICSWSCQFPPPLRPCHECVRTVISEANQWRQRLPWSLPVAGSTHTPTGSPHATRFQGSLKGQRDITPTPPHVTVRRIRSSFLFAMACNVYRPELTCHCMSHVLHVHSISLRYCPFSSRGPSEAVRDA
jgi:hypothetical protein